MPGNENFYIEEFLYRGRRKDDDRPTAWHVIIGVEGADPIGRPYPPMAIMSSEQAVQQGWDIPAVLAEINDEVMRDLEAERGKSAALQEKLDAAQTELQLARDEIERLKENVSAD